MSALSSRSGPAGDGRVAGPSRVGSQALSSSVHLLACVAVYRSVLEVTDPCMHTPA